MKVGVLAVQGDFDAHRKALERLGAEVTLVRKPEQLDDVAGIVIPGGESTAFLKLLEQRGFLDKLREFVRLRPSFGTCAGAILMAREVEGVQQASLGALDISIRRNAYGRQAESFITSLPTQLGEQPLEMVFIRAPKISRVGKGVEVIAEENGAPVLVREGKAMAATFHPELTDDLRVHKLFLDMLRNGNS